MLRHALIGRAVDDHRVRQVIDVQVFDELRDVGGASCWPRAPPSSPSIGNALLGQQHLLAGHDAAQAQVELELVAQAHAFRGDLLEQHAADRARPDQADRDGVRRQIEARMHGAQRARGVLAVDHHRDVALGRALRDGVHVHARRTQRVEHLARHAGQAGHAVADHGEDREVLVDLDALDLAFLDLAIERGGHDARGALGLDAREWRSRSNARSCPAK